MSAPVPKYDIFHGYVSLHITIWGRLAPPPLMGERSVWDQLELKATYKNVVATCTSVPVETKRVPGMLFLFPFVGAKR